MPKGLLFWVIFIIGVILYSGLNWPFSRPAWGGIIIFILIGILGWATFGAIVQ